MPMHGSHEMRVEVVVEIDGHRFSFEERARRVTGARYHGATPPRGFGPNDTLEASFRGTADTLVARAHRRVNETLRRLYPVAGDGARDADAG